MDYFGDDSLSEYKSFRNDYIFCQTNIRLLEIDRLTFIRCLSEFHYLKKKKTMDIIRQLQFIQELPLAFIRHMSPYVKEIETFVFQNIIVENQLNNHLYVIQKGQILVLQQNQGVKFLGELQIFGFESLFNQNSKNTYQCSLSGFLLQINIKEYLNSNLSMVKQFYEAYHNFYQNQTKIGLTQIKQKKNPIQTKQYQSSQNNEQIKAYMINQKLQKQLNNTQFFHQSLKQRMNKKILDSDVKSLNTHLNEKQILTKQAYKDLCNKMDSKSNYTKILQKDMNQSQSPNKFIELKNFLQKQIHGDNYKIQIQSTNYVNKTQDKFTLSYNFLTPLTIKQDQVQSMAKTQQFFNQFKKKQFKCEKVAVKRSKNISLQNISLDLEEFIM